MIAPSCLRRRHGLRCALAALVASLMMMASAAASAQRLVVLPVTGQDVSAAVATRTRRMVLERLSGWCRACVVLDQDGAPTAIPIDASWAAEAARLANAHLAVALNVAHNGRTSPPITTLTLSAYPFAETAPASATNAPTSTSRSTSPNSTLRPFQVWKTTSAGAESLGAIVDELVGAFFARAQESTAGRGARSYPPNYLAGPGPAFPPPPPLPPRPPREIFVGATAGIFTAINTPVASAEALPVLGLFATWITADTVFDAHADTVTSSNRSMTTLGLGAFHRQGDRLLLGVKAKWAWQTLGGRGGSGAVLQPTVGYLIAASGSPIVRVDVGYAVNLYRERELDRLIPGSGKIHLTHGPIATFGVAF